MIEVIITNKETGEEIEVQGKCFFGGVIVEGEEGTSTQVVGYGSCTNEDRIHGLANILAGSAKNVGEDAAILMLAQVYREKLKGVKIET